MRAGGWLILVFGLWLSLAASAPKTLSAQGDSPTFLPVSYGQDIPGTISAEAFFDHWQIDAQAGDVMQIVMTGANGLAPLVGVLDPSRTLQAASIEGAPDGAVSLTYTVPEGGRYIVVATRAGSELGTTTGSYRLRIDNLNPQPTPTPPGFAPLTPVACGAGATFAEADPALSISFEREQFDAVAYSIRVYGFDGFDPVMRLETGERDVCISDSADARGDRILFPDGAAYTRSPDDLFATAQLVLSEGDFAEGSVRLTFANLNTNGSQGRFAAVIGGFRIEPAEDSDRLTLQLAESVVERGGSALIYVIGANNRLDPTLLWDDQRCDDAGRRACSDVPGIAGAGVALNNGVQMLGDRFDAGVRLTTPDLREVQVVSFGGTTRGEYALVIYGN
ncbi:MAG: hypothetical protein L6Q98_22635 [Anaerolineae bacterium]|nr:hypothetical protein [Anaerolineae bacterium]NUQ06100.1 hypothetical protein [Anaerolineae bacterium]